MTDDVAYDINPKWIAKHFGVSLDKAQQAVEYLYESEYFHDHIIEDIQEALEYSDEHEDE